MAQARKGNFRETAEECLNEGGKLEWERVMRQRNQETTTRSDLRERDTEKQHTFRHTEASNVGYFPA